MITLAFGQLVYYLGSGLEAFGGDDGLNFGRSRFDGLIDLRDKASFYWLCFALLCAALWFCGRLVHSRFGFVLRGAKSNEQRMTALGFPVFRYRLVAFTISGVLGTLSGILLGNEGAYVSPAMMSWVKSGDLIVIVVLGGVGALFGPLYGAIAFFAVEEFLKPLLDLAHKGWGEYWQIVFGPLLVLIALYTRGGIDSLLGRPDAWEEADHG
jgi:branched-chain amino acid transport system permease protein